MQPGGCIMSSDRIEKKVLLRAPIQRVWRALTDTAEFEKWFGVRFDQPFRPGTQMRGKIVGTSVDPEVAKGQKQHESIPFEITIEQIDAERLFSFRWHPFAIEAGVDYSAEPTTLIVFALEKAPEGVVLTISESGFDKIPLERRAKAFSANERGWGIMARLIGEYL